MIAPNRAAADAAYDRFFDVADDPISVACDEEYLGEAVVYFPDDVELPEGDIDNDEFAIVAGRHTGADWRLDHGMPVCPCEVCPTCRGWLLHMVGCRSPMYGDMAGVPVRERRTVIFITLAVHFRPTL